VAELAQFIPVSFSLIREPFPGSVTNGRKYAQRRESALFYCAGGKQLLFI